MIPNVVLTGPYYKYHIYRDWLNAGTAEKIPLWKPLLEKSRPLSVIVLIYTVLSTFFHVKVSMIVDPICDTCVIYNLM